MKHFIFSSIEDTSINLLEMVKRKIGFQLVALPFNHKVTLGVMVERVIRAVVQNRNVIIQAPGQR